MDGGLFFVVCEIVKYFAFGLNITFLVFRGTIFYREIIGSVSDTLVKI